MNNSPILLVDSPLVLPLLAIEAIGFVILIWLCLRNGVEFFRRKERANWKKMFFLRTMLIKRITILVGLGVMLQGANVIMSGLICSASGVSFPQAVLQANWSLYPIVWGIWVLAFGVVQYVVLDTAMRYRLRH